MRKNSAILFFLLFIVVFFHSVFINSFLPIPADNLVGLFHPFRDYYRTEYPNGIPYKNFLLTDPIEQQYPWKFLSVDQLRSFYLPLWNPYAFSGTPLLATMQAGVLYPLNIVLFFPSFPIGWSVFVMLSPLLAALFLYLFLRNHAIHPLASMLGGMAFAFSGFMVAWMEWGNVGHTGLWLPIVLLSIYKIFSHCELVANENLKSKNQKPQIKNNKVIIWSGIFIFSLASSFFAGHVQTFFYLFLLSGAYAVFRIGQTQRRKKIVVLLLLLYSLSLILTSVQWIPTLQFITLSAREVDQADWQKPGWFLPWQHLTQFVAPDFFGNPSTLNYWGEWNYAEFVGYIGIIPLIFALYAMAFVRLRTVFFFVTACILSLIFALPTIFSLLPYSLSMPFLATAQPTRMVFITDFSLAVLAGYGFNELIKKGSKKIFFPISLVGICLIGFWWFVFIGGKTLSSSLDLSVTKQNLLLPSLLFGISAFLLSISLIKHNFVQRTIFVLIIMVTAFDLIRFGNKFLPFSRPEYLYPSTKITSFLKRQEGLFRIMTTDRKILHPNIAVMYQLQSVSGYDPLYLRRYGELIAAMERGRPDISPPFGFNRIISPAHYNSKIADLLGVKYVLSLSDIASPKLKKVFQEGETRVYENNNVLPRVFFVQRTMVTKDKKESIKKMFDPRIDLRTTAIIEGEDLSLEKMWEVGTARIVAYTPQSIVVETSNTGEGFLVLVESYYPTWHAKTTQKGFLDGEDTLYRTDYQFRGIKVKKGEHHITFFNTVF